MQKVNSKYKPLFTETDKRYFILMGGRGAGRSTAGSQFAAARLRDPTYFRCAIMRFVLGDIRNSIYQDIRDRIEEEGLEHHVKIREHMLAFEHGANIINGIGFRKSSGDQKSKLKSLANYNTVIIEEADEVAEEDFVQLDDSIRTVKSDIKLVLKLNPPDKNHWIIRRWFNLVPSGIDGFYTPVLKEEAKDDTVFIYTNYEDNRKNLPDTTIANYERYKHTNPDHYYNMIRGLVSEGARGRIYKHWKPMSAAEFDQIPYPSFYALDFGFTNDPTALVEIKMHNENVWVRELLYETGLTNPLIANRLKQLGVDPRKKIYADSAEPKSIEELKDHGYNVIPSEKGPDSVSAGIDMLLSKHVVYTEDSENLKRENQEYKWALDKNKNPTNDPQDGYDHLMDAIRYGVFTHAREGFVGVV